MKLNYECIRSVLLYLEEVKYLQLDGDGFICFEPVFPESIYEALLSSDYSKEDIFYSLFNLDQAGLISLSGLDSNDGIGECTVNYITYEGHEFLEKIKPEASWQKTKGICAKIGTISMDLIARISADVVTSLISAQTGMDLT